MDPAGIASAGANLAGGLASSAFSLVESGRQNRFQENMSNTAHQREVQDLQKAGLNPILSANHGASTPMGSMAAPPDLSHLGDTYNSARATSVAKAQQESQQTVNQATVRKINADASVSEQTAKNLAVTSPFQNSMVTLSRELLWNALKNSDNLTNPEVLKAIKDKLMAESSSAGTRADLLKLDVPKASNDAAAAKTMWGKNVMPYMESAKHGAGLLDVLKFIPLE